MAMFKWMLGGFAGAAIGAVVWILVTYYTNAEVGYVAWGVGVLAGLGVRLSSRYDVTPPSPMQGFLAAGIATLALIIAKYLVVALQMEEAINQPGIDPAIIESRNELIWEMFKSSFGMFDLLWFFLAVSSAYGIANEDKSDKPGS